MSVRSLTKVNRIIHAPARLTIMTILNSADSVDFIYLLKETELTKGNLASHLGKLEENRYLTVEKGYQGRVPLTTYRLTKEGREAFQSYREQLQRFIEDTEPGDGSASKQSQAIKVLPVCLK